MRFNVLRSQKGLLGEACRVVALERVELDTVWGEFSGEYNTLNNPKRKKGFFPWQKDTADQP
jgi:hypothetical protein